MMYAKLGFKPFTVEEAKHFRVEPVAVIHLRLKREADSEVSD